MERQNGTNELARILIKRMKETAEKDAIVDFGTIGNAGHLTTDHLQLMMEKDDYSRITGLSLEKGDRVVVIWIGKEPVVVGKIER